MRQQLAKLKPAEVRRSREHWRSRAEEVRFQDTKAWELFRKQGGLGRKTREERRSSSTG